jgi:hypothetical protein
MGKGSVRRKERDAMDDVQIPAFDVSVVFAGIEETDYFRRDQDSPVDAIAVGHYLGVLPVAAEEALDKAISQALDLADNDWFITQFALRGTIRGELGQPFFLIDPRKMSDGIERLIAIAGMGMPGSFGVPELKILARELAWALGRFGKRHLATVVIGSGNGNLPIAEAIPAWIDGIRQAITGLLEHQHGKLQHLTFVENDPLRVRLIEDAIVAEQSRLKGTLDLRYTRMNDGMRTMLLAESLKREQQKVEAQFDNTHGQLGARNKEPIPTRITVWQHESTYFFAALTEGASIPERPIEVDPELVNEVCDVLAREADMRKQFEHGQFLAHLLLPEDLRRIVFSSMPVVMMLDAKTAGIPWELMAQPDIDSHTRNNGSRQSKSNDRAYLDLYLSMGRGFTRQLRTTFSPAPEPPPPPKRVMNVLIVSNPGETSQLQEAEKEGEALKELFEKFNDEYKTSGYKFDVLPLISPKKAKRWMVLEELTLRPYDILHFAGHGMYDPANPTSSGWIFSGDTKITANELSRIGRLPKFVFSNACESGKHPGEASGRKPTFSAPTFLEAFFSRGISNLICTAWRVRDDAAHHFALGLYSNLIGLRKTDQGYKRIRSQSVCMAMKAARNELAATSEGELCWGAYQHYGNPYLRFFDEAILTGGLTS